MQNFHDGFANYILNALFLDTNKHYCKYLIASPLNNGRERAEDLL